MNLTAKTRLVGIIGHPVSHSKSPAMHNAAFAAAGLDWAYIPLPTAPTRIKAAIEGLKAFNFAGANVTIPHKQAVMRYVDYLDPIARKIGAVNTLAVRLDGSLAGYNTDADGFLKSLLVTGFEPANQRCLVLGAGGAARAVVYALAEAGAQSVTILNRTVERAAFLVDDLHNDYPAINFHFNSLTSEILQQTPFDLVVNTTSLGLAPDVAQTPWPEQLGFNDGVAACDLVYNPLQTRFLQQAATAGLKTIDGLGMLVYQGARAFEIWTGVKPDPTVMRQAISDF